jgi:hypothetical protein
MSAFPQGYVEVSAEARARLEAEAKAGHERATAFVQSQSMGDVVRRQREAEEADAERRRAAGDPQELLAEAHRQLAEAQAEVERVEPLVARARDLVRDIEQGHAAAKAAIAEADRVSAGMLVMAITRGAALPSDHDADALGAAERIGRRLAVARAALAQLEMAEPRQQLLYHDPTHWRRPPDHETIFTRIPPPARHHTARGGPKTAQAGMLAGFATARQSAGARR